MCINNIAHSGKFSSYRTFAEYAIDIWHLKADTELRCYCQADEAFSTSLAGCTKAGKKLKYPVDERVICRESRLDLS